MIKFIVAYNDEGGERFYEYGLPSFVRRLFGDQVSSTCHSIRTPFGSIYRGSFLAPWEWIGWMREARDADAANVWRRVFG